MQLRVLEPNVSQTLLTIDERGSKLLETMFSIAICRQSKTLFLTTFDLRLSIVLTFSIATYPVCVCIVHVYWPGYFFQEYVHFTDVLVKIPFYKV